MTNEYRLLQLLQLGLGIEGAHIGGANAKPKSYSAGEWEGIISLAMEQAVSGMLVCAIERLPKESRPPKPLLMQMIALSEQTRRRSEIVDAVLMELVEEWRGCGIEPIVVKGQVVAREYAMPWRRASGDIDVFFMAEQWSLVERWIAGNGHKYRRSAAEKHIELTFRGVQVELHYHLNVFSSSRENQYWIENIESNALKDSRRVNVIGTPVTTLGTTETLLHQIVHVHHHLLTEGIGLRQLMDMALFLSNHFDEIDFNKLKQHLDGIGHMKAFTAHCALLSKHLGLSKEKIPFELDMKDYVYADKIMCEVWRGGNFGHKNNLKDVKSGLLHSLNTATLVLRHSLQFYRLAPAEARGYWWNKIFWRMKRI